MKRKSPTRLSACSRLNSAPCRIQTAALLLIPAVPAASWALPGPIRGGSGTSPSAAFQLVHIAPLRPACEVHTL